MRLAVRSRPLTDRQAEILAFIVRYRAERGVSPTYRDIRRAFGFGSTNAVHDHLVALERKGHITRLTSGDAGGVASRCIVPTAEAPRTAALAALTEEALSRAVAAFIDDAASVGIGYHARASQVRSHLRAAFTAALQPQERG